VSETHRDLARSATGIAGLDLILEGGLPEGGVYIVQGPPGAGKTILANHVCFNHAAAGNRALYVTVLAESHARMFAHLRRMQFFDAAAVPDRVYYVGAFSVLEEGGLGALTTLIRTEVQRRSATLLVVDDLQSARESAASDRDFNKFIHGLQLIAASVGCVVVLLTNALRQVGHCPEHTMVDGVLHLTDELSHLRPLRYVQVLKLRGTAPLRGLHSVTISDRGFEVRPRIETRFGVAPFREDAVASGARCAFGIAELDAMLHGGVRAGSLTMLVGSSGSGKSLLGLQFLAEGLRLGERVVHFGFYERPDALVAKCERIGNNWIRKGLEAGSAELLWRRPVEGIIDELGESLFAAVRRNQATRLVIDGMNGFEIAADLKERMSDVYAAIAQELEALHVTTVYTVEMRALYGPSIEVPINGMSAATQNIVLLRHVEHRAQLLRALAILKVRDSDYDPRVREIRFTDDGIVIRDTFENQAQLIAGGGLMDADGGNPAL
jgi:circadian clock protein KaiC